MLCMGNYTTWFQLRLMNYKKYKFEIFLKVYKKVLTKHNYIINIFIKIKIYCLYIYIHLNIYIMLNLSTHILYGNC